MLLQYLYWEMGNCLENNGSLASVHILTPHVFSGVSEEDFVTYKGMYGDALSGKLDTEAGTVNLSVEGRGSTKLQSCFGKLKKEGLDFNKLLLDSQDRYE